MLLATHVILRPMLINRSSSPSLEATLSYLMLQVGVERCCPSAYPRLHLREKLCYPSTLLSGPVLITCHFGLQSRGNAAFYILMVVS
jgi:hypothetical protein